MQSASSLLTAAFVLLLTGAATFTFNACAPAAPPPKADPDPYQHIADGAARDLLQKAITRAGGLEAWRRMENLRFKKYFALYDATGAVESEAWQDHDYTFRPAETIRIGWLIDGVPHRMIYQDGQVRKEVNGQVDTTANPETLLNSVLSATFVISLPFKLLDEGVNLSYAGLDTLEDGQVVEVLKATYDPAGNEAHSTPDTWWHFFAREDHRWAAYLVQHADHFSYVINRRDTTASGFVFPAERDSYRVDSLRNPLYLRAKYRYSDYRCTPER